MDATETVGVLTARELKVAQTICTRIPSPPTFSASNIQFVKTNDQAQVLCDL
jgi:hypothetical protein